MTQKGKTNLQYLLYVSLAVALMAVCSFITLPLFVPITLQTLALYFTLFFLGGRGGSIAATLYVSLGALGLPIFSGFAGGIGHLFSNTGGFIFGFIVAALVFWLFETLLKKAKWCAFISASLSLASLYACGVLWYVFVYISSEGTVPAILITVLPTLLFDIVKIFVAYIISSRLSKILNFRT